MRPHFLALAFSCVFTLLSNHSTLSASANGVSVAVDFTAPGKAISPDLFGIFFEDISYAADGGLYAELVQNRSFEYNATEDPAWNNLTSWQLLKRGGAKGSWMLRTIHPVHPNNPHYLILRVDDPGDGIGIANEGFDGIPVRAGDTYDITLFARQTRAANGSGAAADMRGNLMALAARLETKDGALLAENILAVEGPEWTRLTGTLTPGRTDHNARLVLLAKNKGAIALDEISLFPRDTFRNRPNGLRRDLAQTIADLQPKFVRFPGGCVAHGEGINNLYRWKDTIGPVEQRRGQMNRWGYHQSMGLGYYEYFQFCEDIGAKPLPILPAAVSCQFSDQRNRHGQECIPLANMPAYIQEVLDLIEWANGPATSTWGSKRAAAGHPAPFGLQYLGIGNEDEITPEFEERFKMIQDAVRAKHPEIIVIGTAGIDVDGPGLEKGWDVARRLRVPILDEHYYRPPQWFIDAQRRYDTYDRAGPLVYAGEYAAHDDGRHSTLRSALAEAAFLTGLERNADLVRLSSYAPLLAKQGRTHWRPDLIYFNNTDVYPTINYHVQRLFSANSGDTWFSASTTGDTASLATSAVRDSKTGDLILKIVNTGVTPIPLSLKLVGIPSATTQAAKTVLTGDPLATNDAGTKTLTLPTTDTMPLSPAANYEAPANSLTVIRIKH